MELEPQIPIKTCRSSTDVLAFFGANLSKQQLTSQCRTGLWEGSLKKTGANTDCWCEVVHAWRKNV